MPQIQLPQFGSLHIGGCNRAADLPFITVKEDSSDTINIGGYTFTSMESPNQEKFLFTADETEFLRGATIKGFIHGRSISIAPNQESNLLNALIPILVKIKNTITQSPPENWTPQKLSAQLSLIENTQQLVSQRITSPEGSTLTAKSLAITLSKNKHQNSG